MMRVGPRAFIKRLTIACVTACALVAGCVPKNVDTRKPTYYAGPTESLETVVSKINQNNIALPSLWSRHDFQAWIIDDKKKETYVSGDGVLQYRAPDDFRLACNDAAIGEILILGTNPDTYWLTVKTKVDTMWWGRTKHIGSPCAGNIPIDPTLVAQVLGAGQIDTNFLNQPVPILRFNNDDDAYVITWNVRLASKWAVEREIWYDRTTMLPVRVMLYGDKGRVLLRADLSAHKSVKVDGGGEAGAKIATAYDLSFPDTGSRMILRLNDPAVSRDGFPKDIAFRLPLGKPGVSKVIGIDEACGP